MGIDYDAIGAALATELGFPFDRAMERIDRMSVSLQDKQSLVKGYLHERIGKIKRFDKQEMEKVYSRLKEFNADGSEEGNLAYARRHILNEGYRLAYQSLHSIAKFFAEEGDVEAQKEIMEEMIHHKESMLEPVCRLSIGGAVEIAKELDYPGRDADWEKMTEKVIEAFKADDRSVGFIMKMSEEGEILAVKVAEVLMDKYPVESYRAFFNWNRLNPGERDIEENLQKARELVIESEGLGKAFEVFGAYNYDDNIGINIVIEKLTPLKEERELLRQALEVRAKIETESKESSAVKA